MEQKQTYRPESETESIFDMKTADFDTFSGVAEPEFQYGAEVFEDKRENMENTRIFLEEKLVRRIW